MASNEVRRLGFQGQFALLVLMPVVLLAAAILAVTGYALQNILQTLILQRNTAMVSLAAASVSQDLHGYLRPLETTAAALSQRCGDLAAQQALLAEWEPFLAPFEGGVTLLDEHGTAVATTPNYTARMGLNYAFRPYFQAVASEQRPEFSTVLVERPSGQQAVVIAVPVMAENRLHGVLVGVLFLQKHLWKAELGILQTPRDSQAYLVDRLGNILYHPQPEQIGQQLNDPALLALLQEETPQSRLYQDQRGGSERVVAYAGVAGTHWVIVMEEPWQTLVSPVYPYVWATVAAMAAVIGLVTLLLLARLRRILRPVVMLMEQARSVSAGTGFQPVSEQGPAELRLLIRTFNQMVLNLEEQQRRLRRYARQIVRSQEEERQRIARDLHDETVQDLVGLAQRVDLCRTVLLRDPAAASRRLEELQSLTTRAVSEVRRMSNDLRPLILEDLGMQPALQAICRGLERDMPALRVEYTVEGAERRLTDEMELIVFRVTQEALTNVRKHARSATLVQLHLRFEAGYFQVDIGDNGPGFVVGDMDEFLRAGHLGLAGMIERAGLFDGRLTIESQPGEGTRVRLVLPV